MRRALSRFVTTLAIVGGVMSPAIAETVDSPQDVGDELFPGHDLVNVRYTNRTGSVVVTAQVEQLHASDQLGVSVRTKDVRDYNFFISVKVRNGQARARVYPFDFNAGGLDFEHPTCEAHAEYDYTRHSIRVRAQDLCFGDHDLSTVLLSTDLGVRGKNNVSDMTGNRRVHRD